MPEIFRLARKIERYLQAHPRAADSLEGVVQWWLPATKTEWEAAQVQRALEHLVNKGVVRKTVLLDGRILYGGAEHG
jgi:Fe2+ or Zn2+ uptake regulation protein